MKLTNCLYVLYTLMYFVRLETLPQRYFMLKFMKR